MAITIKLHNSYLKKFTDDRDTITVNGKTVGECIADLERQYPSVRQSLQDENGTFRDYWEIYVNSASAYPEEMTKAVKDGDEIALVAVISGG